MTISEEHLFNLLLELCLLASVLISLPLDDNVHGVHASMLPQAIPMDPKLVEVTGNAHQSMLPSRFESLSVPIRPTIMNLVEVYIIMLSRWGPCDFIDANEQPLKLLLPVLELHFNRYQATATHHYRIFLEERGGASASGFESLWRPLRDTMVSAALPFEVFKRYDSFHADGAVQQSPKLQRLLKRFDHICKRVSQFEQPMRDELQLEVGHLNLEESKESIKQSKIAIEESKRLKMRTHISYP